MGDSLTKQQKIEALNAYHSCGGNKSAAARLLELPVGTYKARLNRALEDPGVTAAEFERDPLPSELPTAEELLKLREKEFDRKNTAENARKLVPVRVKLDGPIGILHLGDPHVDDPGTDIYALQRHVRLIQQTPGLFGANVGDLHNNWVGRLARLYAEQSTTAQQAWVLVEWLVTSCDWLYLILGNHDCWTGAGNPIDWMRRGTIGVTEAHGARLALTFPNGKVVRINARHDFTGHSMWSPIHGAAKAVQMGWRDHILTCGHKHTSGFVCLKCPATGLLSHAIRVAGYKIHDSYGKEKGLPNQNISPAFGTIIDPRFEDDDPRLIHTVYCPEHAADYLTWLRERYEKGIK